MGEDANRKKAPPRAGVVEDFPAAARAKACPICKRPVATEFRPFCSRRCADLDLARWLDGSYAVPAVEPPDGMLEGEPDFPTAPAPGRGEAKDQDRGGG